MSHVKSCLCYECISDDEPKEQRRKIIEVVNDMLNFKTDFLNDWMFFLTLETSGSFSPTAIQFIQCGGPIVLLKLLTHAYTSHIPLDQRIVQESTGDDNPEKEYPTYAAMVLSRYLDKESDSHACPDLIRHNIFEIIERALNHGISTVRRSCIHMLNSIVSVFSNFDGNQKRRQIIVQSLLREIRRPRDTLKNELNTNEGRIQRELLQEDEHREGFADRYMELLKLDAIRVLKIFIMNDVDQFRMEFIRQEHLVDDLLDQLVVYPHESLPESTCLFDICEILIALTHIPFQFENVDYSYQHEICKISPNFVNSLVVALVQLNEIVVTEHVYEIHRKAAQIGLNYDPKEMEKWGLHLYNSRLAMVTIINQLSMNESVRDEIATCHDGYVLKYATNVLQQDCNDPFVGYIKSEIGNAPFIRSMSENRTYASCGPDILGACVITVRNLSRCDQLSESSSSIQTQFQEWMLKSAMRYKYEGVELVKQREKEAYTYALGMFTTALYILPTRDSYDSNLLENSDIRSLCVTLLSNRAEMYIQLKDPQHAKVDAENAIMLDPTHEKSKSRLQRATKLIELQKI
jgi:hypothetical protein